MELSEKLPPSLETFHATISTPVPASHTKDFTIALEQLATDSACQTPLLTEVHIDAKFRTGCDWPRVVAAFSRTSVEFTVREGDLCESPRYSPTRPIYSPASPIYSPASPIYSQHSATNNVETESESSGEVSLYSN
jgi:hypothetical protein